MTNTPRPMRKSPAELRSMFGSNLRHLAQNYPSISELSRQLGINRTQFNRYLAGESFPRPDVLSRICDFFDVDARVLLEPVEALREQSGQFTSPEMVAFHGSASLVDEDMFPSGFYRFTRRSFMDPEKFVIGIVRIWRNSEDHCCMRGFEAREALRQQGLRASAVMREFRGAVMRFENGVGILVSRRNGASTTFNFLNRVVSFESNFWNGYVSRTVAESMEAERISRMVYEHLGTDIQSALKVARTAGLVHESDLPEFHGRLLKGSTPFR